MKESTKLLLFIIKELEERSWTYSINDGKLYFILGNQEYEAKTTDEEKLQEILHDILFW